MKIFLKRLPNRKKLKGIAIHKKDLKHIKI